jgi:hypothetical protein
MGGDTSTLELLSLLPKSMGWCERNLLRHLVHLHLRAVLRPGLLPTSFFDAWQSMKFVNIISACVRCRGCEIDVHGRPLDAVRLALGLILLGLARV